MVSNSMLALTDSKVVTLLLINVILLIVGTFMDATPAILIFTPIFMPICVGTYGMSELQFGIMLCYNLCIGAITPPVGTVLFTGCKIGGTTIEKVFKTLLPYFAGNYHCVNACDLYSDPVGIHSASDRLHLIEGW